jgi:hypothetical protein
VYRQVFVEHVLYVEPTVDYWKEEIPSLLKKCPLRTKSGGTPLISALRLRPEVPV